MDLTATLYNVNYPNGLTGLEVKPGAVFREQFNETLDSATIIISQRTSPLLIEPFDIIIVSGNDFTTKRLAVNTITERIISFDPLTYEYQIELFSETKILENYVCPNLSITQPANQSEKKSVSFYLLKYISLYGGKIRVRKPAPNTDEWEWANKFSVNADLLAFFDDVICPELQWNNPTLREVLTDLMMVEDRIPVLRGKEILALDISQKGSSISTSNLNLAQRMISSGDAVSELRLSMENAFDKKKEGTDTVVRRVEYHGLRTSAGTFVNTENMELITDNPIYTLLKVTVMVPFLDADSNYQWIEADITEHCVERGIYDLLNPSPVSLGVGYTYSADYKNYKQFNVFYNRGGNTIAGFGNGFTTNEFLWITWQEFAIESILRFAVSSQAKPGSLNYMDLVFRVEYETVASVLLDVGRTYDVKVNERIVFDNQSNSYVDVVAQGKFTQSKVNRLGNDVMMISGRYPTEVSVPTLPSLFDVDRVIFSREISVYQDFCNVSFMAAKNYVLRDYFVGVQSRKRNFELAGESSFVRHDLKKVYAEFSFVPKFDKKLTILSAEKFDALYLVSLKRDNIEPLILTAGKTEDPYSSDVYPNSTDYFGLELDKKITANSLVLTTTFSDNYSAGEQIVMRSVSFIDQSNLTRTLDVVPYANENNGEFDRINLWFLKEYDPGDGVITFPFDGKETASGSISTEITGYNVRHRSRPLIKGVVGNDAPIILDLPIYKDNKEIVKVTNQVEYCSDTRDIVFTDRFLRLLKPIREEQFPEYRFQAIGTSALNSNSNNFNVVPVVGGGEYKDPANFLGKSVIWEDTSTLELREFVSELTTTDTVWEEYDGDWPTPINDGSGNFFFTGSGSAYSAIHKLGNVYGVWAANVSGAVKRAYFVKFDGTGVWNGANDDFYQLATTTVENTAGAPSLTASLVKGFMAVTFDGSNYRAWFSLPIANFDNAGVLQSANFGWVEKSSVIGDLFNGDRIYLLSGTRYRWNGTGWSQLVNTELPYKYKVVRSTSETYGEYDLVGKGSEYVNAVVVFESITDSTARIRLVSILGLPYVSWGIVDENGKLLVGVNGTNRNVYLNILRKRDTRVFENDNGLKIVGSINDTLTDEYAV